MTTEEQAKEYATKEHCTECVYNLDKCALGGNCDGFKESARDFENGYNKANRWRDVNNELPMYNTEFIAKMDRLHKYNYRGEFATNHILYLRISLDDAECRAKLLEDGCIAWRPI